jgi:uncharacterized membrane protein
LEQPPSPSPGYETDKWRRDVGQPGSALLALPIPFLTDWVAKYYRDSWPAACYGIVALAAALNFTALLRAIIRADLPDSTVAAAVGDDRKGKISLLIYAVGVALAFVSPWISYSCYAIVSIIWFIPDSRLI